MGNLVTVTDPRGGQSSHTYDLAHRLMSTTDPAGETTLSGYDLDGMVVATTDEEGVTTEVDRDERGLVAEVRVPHDEGLVRTTRYEYDPVGNRTKVITPRSVEAGDPDAFVTETVYDELNRVAEQRFPFDPSDPVFNTPDTVQYAYDAVGNLVEVSAPPSDGQSVRNTTRYTHFDNGWVNTSTDAWDIVTSYDYNEQWYNNRRLHGACGYRPPTEFEALYELGDLISLAA